MTSSPIYAPSSQVGGCGDGTSGEGKSQALGECQFVHVDMRGQKKGKHFMGEISHCVELRAT